MNSDYIDVLEALEKMRLGLYIMIREGSAAKDLDALLPLLKEYNTRKCIFVTDDRHPTDLNEHINGMVRRAVAFGVSPMKAIQCASLNIPELKITDKGLFDVNTFCFTDIAG